MNKTELIAAVAEKTGMSKKDTEAVISATLGTITAALHEEEKVQLMGFGSFEVKKRAARTGRNPRFQGRQGPEGRRGQVKKSILSGAGVPAPLAHFQNFRRSSENAGIANERRP